MVHKITGEPKVGSVVKFSFRVGKVPVPSDAEIVVADSGRELRWTGPTRRWMRFFIRGSHYYRIVEIGDDRVRLEHGEEFAGTAVPGQWRRVEDMLAPVYTAFNRALKRRVESAARPSV